jgi:amidase
VASGAAPIAHGTDGGGSIRIPASCCGLVGLKVSRNRHLPAGRPQPGLSISVPGCLSRSVRDTALWLSVTERSDSEAPFTPVGLVAGPNTRRMRIGYRTASWINEEPAPDVAAAIENTAELCRSLGHLVTEAPNPINGDAFAEDFSLLWAAMAAAVAQEVVAAASTQPLDRLLEPLTLGLAAMYRAAPADALPAAIARMRAASALYEAMYADFDVLLTPVLASTPPPIGELSPTLAFDVGFPRLQAYVGYTPLMNAAGAPAISLPLGWSADSMPIGAQFAAPAGGEQRLLELAYELEQAEPWADRRPQVWAG